jgi:hypothetical protein
MEGAGLRFLLQSRITELRANSLTLAVIALLQAYILLVLLRHILPRSRL